MYAFGDDSGKELATGTVKALKSGIGKTVKITAIAKDGSGVKAAYSFKIVKGVVKKVTVTGAKTIKVGKSLKLKGKASGTKGANTKLVWSCDKPKFATVNSSGKVKALKAGKGKTVKITATSTDGSNIKKTVKIKIK